MLIQLSHLWWLIILGLQIENINIYVSYKNKSVKTLDLPHIHLDNYYFILLLEKVHI